MGLNSVIMIFNDRVHDIEAAPDVFWRRAWDALQRSSELPFNFGLGEAISMHHADYTSLIAVGGNYSTVLGMTNSFKHHLLEDKVRLLNAAAEKLGYKLTKIAMRTCEICLKKTRRFKYRTHPDADGGIVCPECFEEHENDQM